MSKNINKRKLSLFGLLFAKVVVISIISVVMLMLFAKIEIDKLYRDISFHIIYYDTENYSYSVDNSLNSNNAKFPSEIDMYFDIMLFGFWCIGALLICLIIIILYLFQRMFISKHIKDLEEMFLFAKQGLTSRPLGRFLSKEIYSLFLYFHVITKDLIIQVKNIAENVDEKLSMELDMKIARQIQNAILPSESFIPSGIFADSLDVGAKLWGEDIVASNFYDYFSISSNKVAFLIGNVSREGLAGAFYMMTIKSIIKKTCVKYSDSPADALDEINRQLTHRNKTDMFVSLVLCYFDFKKSVLSFSKVGEINLVYIPSSGNIASLSISSDNHVLGFIPDVVYKYNELFMMRNDKLIVIDDKEKYLSADDLKINISSVSETFPDLQAIRLCEKIAQELKFEELSGNSGVMVVVKK